MSDEMPTMPTAPKAAATTSKPAPNAAKPAPRGNFPPPPAKAAKPASVDFDGLDDDNAPTTGHRINLFGTGGIGKTTLAADLPAPIAFFDLDGSLPILKTNLKAQGLAANIRRVKGVTDWASMLAKLNGGGWDDVKTIVIDTATRAEALALAHTLKTKPTDKGAYVTSIEGYGFGKGYVLVAETFAELLAALDAHAEAGRNVVLISHECTATVPNPEGEDWIRYEPRLQNPPSGKASIRLMVKEWCDHCLFMGYDVVVKNGVAKGCGSRTIYCREMPHCMAKSRTASDPIPADEFTWADIIK